VQEWSDACRRCKCDLRLLRETAASFRLSRRRCLEALRDGRPQRAYRFARHGRRLYPDAESRRLLALCALLCGDWAEAAMLARDLSEVGRPST
jgi:predicted ArsR family transcriptional regulator